MPKKIALLSALLLLAVCVSSQAEPRVDLPTTEAELNRLRSDGPSAVDEVLARLDALPGGTDSLSADERDRLDRLCGVRDCASLRLFWYTDFEAARAAAEASGKPMLSLRLLGRLDEDLSCANSRFFRTVLYANREIGQLLRERFVLHWRSVRPVPKVTIDFGDGRRLERTLVGNSIHYVLDRQGRLVDGLPGLYGPEVFRRELMELAEVAQASSQLGGLERLIQLKRHHLSTALALREALETDLSMLEPRVAEAPGDVEPAVTRGAASSDRDPWEVLKSVPGVLVDRVNLRDDRTGSKSNFVGPVLSALQPDGLGATLEDGRWQELAALHPEAGRLDAASRAFLIRKQGIEEPERARRMIASFERSVALDTIFNQYQLRRVLSVWLESASSEQARSLESLNDRVYRELFDSPPEDPWFGLVPDDVYSALDSGGERIAVSGSQ